MSAGDVFNTERDRVSAESQLYMAVIGQLIKDAFPKTIKKCPTERFATRDARHFIAWHMKDGKPTQHIIGLCDNAGLNPHQLAVFLWKVYEGGTPEYVALILSKRLMKISGKRSTTYKQRAIAS